MCPVEPATQPHVQACVTGTVPITHSSCHSWSLDIWPFDLSSQRRPGVLSIKASVYSADSGSAHPLPWPGRERTLVWPEAVEMAEWRRLAAFGHGNCAHTSISLRSPEIRPRAAGVALHGAVGNTPDSSPRQPLGLPTLSSAGQGSGGLVCPSLTGCSRSTSQINYLHSTPASALRGGKPSAHHASRGP